MYNFIVHIMCLEFWITLPVTWTTYLLFPNVVSMNIIKCIYLTNGCFCHKFIFHLNGFVTEFTIESNNVLINFFIQEMYETSI